MSILTPANWLREGSTVLLFVEAKASYSWLLSVVYCTVRAGAYLNTQLYSWGMDPAAYLTTYICIFGLGGGVNCEILIVLLSFFSYHFCLSYETLAYLRKLVFRFLSTYLQVKGIYNYWGWPQASLLSSTYFLLSCFLKHKIFEKIKETSQSSLSIFLVLK
jgi:hypothetical protein